MSQNTKPKTQEDIPPDLACYKRARELMKKASEWGYFINIDWRRVVLVDCDKNFVKILLDTGLVIVLHEIGTINYYLVLPTM